MGDILCVSLLAAERAQMSSSPKLQSVFGSIFWSRELGRFEMQNGAQGFTGFAAMEFGV